MTNYADRYGKWALVLGGSEGLGRAIAMELAQRKMNVALAARRQGPLDEAAEMIAQTHGVETKTISLDLARDDVVQQIEAGMGGEDVSFLAYNAAAEPFGEFLDLELDEHLWNIALNITTVTRVTHHFGRKMKQRGRGGIVLCSSLAAAAGLYTWVSYGAAKAYDNILGEGLWYELQQYGVDPCSFMIGTTWTDNFQRTQKRLGGVFADSREPANLPAGMSLPQLPEEAAGNLFAQTDKAWLPVIFANPEDQARWTGMTAPARAEIIRMAAEAQKAWYA
jgi:short-subunit dehydrogenase